MIEKKTFNQRRFNFHAKTKL